MTDDGRSELISRHLQEGATLEGELALLSKQPADKQAVMQERLEAIDEYLRLPSPSVEDVDAAAVRLDVSRRQFYRLLAKLRSLGPVRALVPGMQNVARASAAREGLDEPIEAVLVEALLKEPDAKIANLQSILLARDLKPPKEWMLRQRVHALRASGKIDPHAIFGSRIVVDQIGVDLPVESIGGTSRFGTLTAIIDRSTRLVLGASITVSGLDAGLHGALSDMTQIRMPAFRGEPFPVAVRMSELTWVVPPNLENFADAVTGEAARRAPALLAHVISQGPRRHGESIMRLLGDRLGPYVFRTRSPLGRDIERPQTRGNHLEDAQRMIGYCIDAWNRKILPHLPRVPESDLRKRRQRLTRIAKEVDEVFRPVTEQIAARFPREPGDYF